MTRPEPSAWLAVPPVSTVHSQPASRRHFVVLAEPAADQLEALESLRVTAGQDNNPAAAAAAVVVRISPRKIVAQAETAPTASSLS